MEQQKSPHKINMLLIIVSVVFAIIAIVLGQLIAGVVSRIFLTLGTPVFVGNIIIGIVYCLISVLLTVWYCKKVLKLHLSEINFGKFKVSPLWIFLGTLIPLIVVGIYLILPHDIIISKETPEGILNTLSFSILISGMATGIVEELLFRGLLMKLFELRLGRITAIIVPSFIFGIVHMLGNSLDTISIIQMVITITLVGSVFSLVTYVTGSIWTSVYMHAIWNIVFVNGILHIGVTSGTGSLINIVPRSNSYLVTGGDFGVETSLITVLVYLAFGLIALYDMKKININKSTK